MVFKNLVLTISITLMLMKLVLPIADAQQDNQNMTESNTINGMMNMMQDDQERMSSTTVMDQMMIHVESSAQEIIP